jgi:hypothetical protein
MKWLTKGAFAVLVAALPAAYLLSDAAGLRADDGSGATAISYREKNDSRLESDAAPTNDKAASLVRLAQAEPLFGEHPPGRPPFGPPPGEFMPFGRPIMPGARLKMGPPSTRSACHDRLNRHAAVVGYLKSKLRLRDAQKDAWRKLEDAAQPSIEKLQELCDRLPVEATAPPDPPDMLDRIEEELTAHIALLHAIRDPLRALYATLTPEQKSVLRPPVTPP